ncbi:S24 family peptidase [Parapedobacter sp. 10938]|uniref:S24 family peptidase n=1 Tax=Parapedobacter flavus TaxID=3110225 RepID=UPI002DB7F950|nr:S24 family peptidase [Parapedobacter sp. 10938]MEC3880757.1 S24 family peptidase [Parapedobacter sp. 10938]
MKNIVESIDLQSEKVGPRLKEVRNSLGMTVEEFYSPLMKAFNNGSSIENNKRNIGKRLAKDIIEYYNINPNYLHTGKGDKVLKVRPYHKKTFQPQPAGNEESVPFFDVKLTQLQAGFIDIFSESVPEYYVNYRPFNDCAAYLPIYGDSMFPRFVNGEIIAVKEVVNRDVILWGEAYLVVTDERANSMITVKLLHQHEEAEKIILRASNPAYSGDTVIDKAAIVRLYIIKGKITRSQL